MSTTNIVEEKVIHELLKVVNLDIAIEDDEILIEALGRTLKGDVERLNLDLHEIVKKLKREYFKRLREEFLDNLAKVRTERKQYIPEKQLMYLAATIFAESILKKPAPASLIFEILRCAGMEEERNFPNRYYFLRQLEEKGFVKKVTVVNSKAEQLYCPTEEGVKIVNGTEAFNRLIQLKEKIIGDSRVKKLVELYSKEELEICEDLPKILATSKVISENEDRVKVLLYGNEVVNLTREEIKEINSVAKSLGRFAQSGLRKHPDVKKEKKAMAYIVYAYEKGWIRVAEKGPRDSVIFERVPDYELDGDNL